MRRSASSFLLIAVLTASTVLMGACAAQEESSRTVRAVVQPRPGAEPEEIDMRVHEAPVEPPSVEASEVELADDELVLGLVLDGQPIAYPVRYLATVEVLNDTVGETSIAPTW